MNSTKTITGSIAFVIGLPTTFFCGFVISQLWNWFLVPATNFNPINAWIGWGLLLLVSMFHTSNFLMSLDIKNRVKKLYPDDSDDYSDLGNVVARLLGALLIWGIGALIHFNFA